MGDFGALSSLGIGSGVLNYDVIDKLKKADEGLMIDPIKSKLDLTKKREEALSQFITIASTVKTDVMDLADGTLFAKVNTDVSGSSVSVNANDGVKPQSFDIDVEQLAKNDVYQSAGFASPDSSITSEDTKIKIGVGGSSVSIDIKSGTTLDELKDAINNADVGVTAQIIDTGVGDNPYKLVLKANDTGKDNTINFEYFGTDDLGLNATNYTSASFDSDSDSVNNSGDTQTFSITINGTKYSMDVADGESVSDFIDDLKNGKLTDSDGNSIKVDASYTDGKIEFNLQAIGDIKIDDTNLLTNFNDNTDFTNDNRLQTAQDALFKYNGVEIERSSNKVDDLIVGVEINLQSTGSSRVDITSNVDEITKSIQQFVADYNAMMSNLQNLTAFNKDTGTVGLFQGFSEFSTLARKLPDDIFGNTLSYETTQLDYNGNKYTGKAVFTAADLGLSLNKNGLLSFDEEKFKDSFQKHPDLVERFSSMAFSKVKEDFNSLATDDNSVLELLSKQLKRDEKNYENRIDSLTKFLDTKYEIMAKQFASYDDMINNFNAMSSSLNMVIQQALNSKK